jgi:membrane protease YdiL (CAAX protease family)
LLGAILLNFTDPRFFAAEFVVLFVIGLILAWSRVRTGGLWFAIGLHAGWIAAFKSFNLLHQLNPESPLHPWGVGESLRAGLLPLATLAITAVLCRCFLGAPGPENTPTRPRL